MNDFEVEDYDFYTLLSRQLVALFRAAQDTRCVICMPPNGSLPQTHEEELIRLFARSHILRPSKEFLGAWTCFDDPSRTIEEDGRFFVTKGPWPEQRRVRILSEDVIYNKRNEAVRVCFLEMAFLGPHSTASVQSFPTSLNALADLLVAHSTRQARFALDTRIQQFCLRYSCVEGYEDAIREKIDSFYRASCDEILSGPMSRVPASNRRLVTNIQLAVHSYILSGVHCKLFGHFQAIHRKDEANFRHYTRLFRALDPSEYGVPETVVSCFAKPIQQMQNINKYTNAFEMIVHLNNVLTSITEEVNALLSEQVSADLMVPLLIHVIIQSDAPHLPATADYLEYFTPENLQHSQFNYARISFTAAVGYVQQEGHRKFGDDEEAAELEQVEPLSGVMFGAPILARVPVPDRSPITSFNRNILSSSFRRTTSKTMEIEGPSTPNSKQSTDSQAKPSRANSGKNGSTAVSASYAPSSIRLYKDTTPTAPSTPPAKLGSAAASTAVPPRVINFRDQGIGLGGVKKTGFYLNDLMAGSKDDFGL